MCVSSSSSFTSVMLLFFVPLSLLSFLLLLVPSCLSSHLFFLPSCPSASSSAGVSANLLSGPSPVDDVDNADQYYLCRPGDLLNRRYIVEQEQGQVGEQPGKERASHRENQESEQELRSETGRRWANPFFFLC